MREYGQSRRFRPIKGDKAMSRVKYALLGLMLIGILGCSDKTTENAEQPPPEAEALAPQPAVEEPAAQIAESRSIPEEAPQVSAPAPVRKAPASRPPSQTATQAPADVTEAIKAAPRPSEPEPAPPVRQAVQQQTAPQVQEPRYMTIPAGTAVQVRLLDALDSSINKSGDTFRAILDRDIDVNGSIVASRGNPLQGKLSNVSRSGRVEGRATMSLRLVNLEIGGQSYPLQTQVLAFEAESSTKEDATKVGIGAGIGAVIGAIAGGGKGAAIGAAVGGSAGGATVLATRGKEVKFDPEQKFSFTLSEDVSVRLQ